MELTEAAMERVFAVLKHDWVYDFFFASRPHELDMLRHAATKGSATTAELDLTALADGVPHENALQVGEHHRLLLMPSFTTGSITVGFAVNEKIASSSTVICNDKYIGRLARDDATGTCLFISENFNEHITEVSFYTLLSAAHREHIFSLFKAKPFHRIISRMREHFNTSALLRHMVYYYVATEARPCVHCGAETAHALATCNCKVVMPRKLHPLDTDAEYKSLQCYTGAYCGVATVSFFKAGASVFTANLTTNSATTITADPDVQRRLAIWALCSAVKDSPISPLTFTMGSGASGGEKAVSVLDSFLLASIADSVLSEGAKRANMSPDSEPTSIRLLQNDPDSNLDPDQMPSPDNATAPTLSLSESSEPDFLASPLLSQKDPMIPQTHDSGPHAVTTDSYPFPPEQQFPPDPVALTQMPQVFQYMSQPPHPPLPATLLPSSLHQTPRRYAPGHDPAAEARSERGGVNAKLDRSGSTILSGNSMDQGMGNAIAATSVERQSEPVPLAPMPLMQPMARFILPSQSLAAAAMSGGVSKILGDDLDERRKKAELRKARNRESAQRSNHKRKLRIQALKADIAEAMRIEKNLRATEKRLREENRSLRLTASN